MKNKLMLLVSMLLPLVSSCGDNPTIELTPVPTDNPTVEPTEEPTTEPTQDLFYNYNEASHVPELFSFTNGEPISPYGINSFLNGTIQTNLIYELTKFSDDFFTCIYIHNDDLKFIEDYENQWPPKPLPSGYNSINWLPFFSGIDCGFLNYLIFSDSSPYFVVNHEFSKPKWYEIPLNDEIPKIIGDYSLVLISRKCYYNIYDMNKNNVGQMAVFVEQSNHELYSDSVQFNNQLNLPEYYIENKNKEFEMPVNLINYGQSSYYQYVINGYDMVKIDGNDYICFIPRTLKDEELISLLIEKYEYIKEENGYLFKLFDIALFIGQK